MAPWLDHPGKLRKAYGAAYRSFVDGQRKRVEEAASRFRVEGPASATNPWPDLRP